MIKTGLTWSVICLVIMAGISAYGWVAIPDGAMVARHWDINGNPDGYSSKNMILFGQPALALFIALLLAVVPTIFPRRENLERSRAFYLVAWVGAMILLVVVHGTIVWGGATGETPSIALVIGLVGLFFAVIGNYMAKSKSNWAAGLRNPWTLSSEHAWTIANRLCGYLFVVTGIAVIISSLMAVINIAVYILLGGSLFAVTLSTVVSYFAWRNDPEARSGA